MTQSGHEGRPASGVYAGNRHHSEIPNAKIPNAKKISINPSEQDSKSGYGCWGFFGVWNFEVCDLPGGQAFETALKSPPPDRRVIMRAARRPAVTKTHRTARSS